MEAQAYAKKVLLGTAIADATIRRRSINQQANIRVGHSINKAEYLFWKYKHIKKLVEVRNFNLIDGGVYKKSPNDYVYFQSISSPTLSDIHSLIYRDKRKKISEEFLHQVDEITLAVWFMDDGYYDKHPDSLSYSLSTNAFSLEENEMISEYLKTKFGLTPRLQYIKRSNAWALYFRRYDTWNIEKLIQPVVSQVECMKYKLASSHLIQPNKLSA